MGLVIDNFAGGGGASTGIEAAFGRPVDIAINHSDVAIAMHAINHPWTRHYCENIWQVDPKLACGGEEVDLVWLSPDCTHHSKAKGGKPRDNKRRGLAWVAVRWARAVKPKLIVLENVEEFEDWGPLDAHGKPDEGRKGETFRAFVAKIISYGYSVRFTQLVAADYGTPTTRKRLFLVARRDGSNAVWPMPSHGHGRRHPWRTAAEVIDWTLPTRSIFGRKKPLAPATLRRIAAGVKRYVLDSPAPFLIKYHGGEGRQGFRGQPLDQPLRTVDTENRFGLVTPFLSMATHTTSGERIHSIEEPLRTVTTARGGEFMLVSPTLIQTGYGERPGQSPRVPGLHKPLGTVMAGGQKHALVAAFLAKHYTMPGGRTHPGVSCKVPLGTVTTVDHHSLVLAELAAHDHSEDVSAFLVKYYGSDGHAETQKQAVDEPLDTVTTRDRFGLVTVHGQDYRIVDIALRMLAPEELFRAQGFADGYVTEVTKADGRPLTKAERIELCGNSVCPQIAEAVVAANVFGRADVALRRPLASSLHRRGF